VVPQAKQVPGLKPLPLAERAGGPFVVPSHESFENRSYPLVRNLYFYVNRKPGTAMDPKLREFLRYVLSREGQDEIAKHGAYLPLPAEMAAQQARRLD
jgi:phosphate transport system substrate-binding protein